MHQFILALQGKMKIALVRMNLRISWKIFLHRKWDLNRPVSKVWYGKRKQLGFGRLNVSPWLNCKMHWNTYDETNVPIRTVLLPNALSMGALTCMSIYFVYLIRCWWMVTLRKRWKQTTFSMIPKTGDPTNPGNGRPLAILNITYKIFIRMVCKRVKPILEAQQSKDQIGFRSSVGVDDAFAVFENVCSKSMEWSVPMWCASLDLRKAFDRIEYNALFDALLIFNAERTNAIPILGGDFNAAIGAPQVGDDLSLIGACGNGVRNHRGARMIQWILERGLQVLNRLDSTMAIQESWTCKRAVDGALVQLDFLLANLRVRVMRAWVDQGFPIGLDHRCVHCLIRIGGVRPAQIKRCAKLKHWQPYLDENGTPSGFHTTVATALTNLPLVSAEALEQCLVVAGRNHGRRGFQQLRFVSSRLLTDLRFRRRQTNDPQEQKQLSFQIRKLHRKELRDRKSNQMERLLEQSSNWKILRTMDSGTGRWLPEQPQPFEFADLLEQLFAGNPGRPMVEPCLTEAPWTMAELKKAITRLKTNKAADDVGLVAELLHHSPEVMLEALLHLFRTVLFTGEVPETWKQTVFNMLPKTRGAKSTSDFRPIAVVRLLYKTFAYLVLGRIEATLDAGQPEEQHGSRADRRIEEHLLTTNLVLDKTLSLDVPVWIVSLDLSKAFDKVKWENLWEALSEHGVSDHMLWVLQCMYYGQTGRIGDNSSDGEWFCIRGGVRQGCVLSPRLFSCVLEVALGCWRRKVGNAGMDF